MKQGALVRVQFTLSMVIFGTLALFVRNISLSSGEVALFRAMLAALLIGAYLLFKKINPVKGVVRKDLLLLLASGAAMGFNWILLFEAYRYTTVSVATLCYYFAPVLVALVCPFLFGERMTQKQLVCFLASTLGVALIVGVGGIGGGNHLLGMVFGLGAALLYASVMLLNKYIKSVQGISRTFLQFLAAIAVLLPYVLVSTGIHLSALDRTGWLCLLVTGLFHTGFTYCLYFSSLYRLRGGEVAILSYIDPLVAVVLSVAVLREHITPWQILGGTLVLGFSILNELKWHPKKSKRKGA